MKSEIIKSTLKAIGFFLIEILIMLVIIYFFERNNFTISWPSVFLGVVFVHCTGTFREIVK